MKEVSFPVFKQLISPISDTEFWSEYFENKAFFTEKSFLKTGFSLDKFENLLWAHKFDLSENVQVNKGGEAFFYNKVKSGKDHFGWLMDQYHDGCTLIFNGIDKLDPTISKIARALDFVFRGQTTVNAFLTPATSKGFLPHFDTHDVFIIQIEGEKDWSLYQEELKLPIDRQIYLIDQEKLEEPTEKHKLSEGGVLYIPRGLVHGSFTTKSYSLHLTIGVRPLLADEYLKTFVDVLSEQEVVFRQSILKKDESALAETIQKLIKLIEDKSESIYFTKLVNERIDLKNNTVSKPPSGNRLKTINKIEVLLPDTPLRNVFYKNDLLLDHADKIRLIFPGIGISGNENVQQGFIELPAVAYGAISFIREKDDPFCANDIPEIYPIATRLMLLKTLLKNGYLEFA